MFGKNLLVVTGMTDFFFWVRSGRLIAPDADWLVKLAKGWVVR